MAYPYLYVYNTALILHQRVLADVFVCNTKYHTPCLTSTQQLTCLLDQRVLHYSQTAHAVSGCFVYRRTLYYALLAHANLEVCSRAHNISVGLRRVKGAVVGWDWATSRTLDRFRLIDYRT